jgi:glc operon protein GlcG
MALTLEGANLAIQGALAKASELNVRVSVAICDAGGRLIAFQRMDNSILASQFASQGKAIHQRPLVVRVARWCPTIPPSPVSSQR